MIVLGGCAAVEEAAKSVSATGGSLKPIAVLAERDESPNLLPSAGQ
jgi:hypothetical protein